MKLPTLIHGIGFSARQVVPGLYEIVTRVAHQRRHVVSPHCIPASAIHTVLSEWDALYERSRPRTGEMARAAA